MYCISVHQPSLLRPPSFPSPSLPYPSLPIFPTPPLRGTSVWQAHLDESHLKDVGMHLPPPTAALEPLDVARLIA